MKISLKHLVALTILITSWAGSTIVLAESPGELGDDSSEAADQAVDEQDEKARLAEKFAPIVYLGEQDKECDQGADPYSPSPVEIVLDNPKIDLKRDVSGRPVIAQGPSQRDIFDKGEEYFLDFPGNPRRPGCTYETDYRQFIGNAPAVAYAHIKGEQGVSGLALQYWLFYYYNQWNNLHEGDWEMIQLTFNVNSVSEALGRDPISVAYSQHSGGETASWDDDKLEKEGNRPVIYVSRGAHANFFQPGVYVGVARARTGFGCESSLPPHRRVPLGVKVLPDEATGPDDPFAWIEFSGRWGEPSGRLFSGSFSPKHHDEKWNRPLSWEQGLRNYSDKIPGSSDVGSDPLTPICWLIGAGSFQVKIEDDFHDGHGREQEQAVKETAEKIYGIRHRGVGQH